MDQETAEKEIRRMIICEEKRSAGMKRKLVSKRVSGSSIAVAVMPSTVADYSTSISSCFQSRFPFHHQKP